MIKKSSS